MGALDIFNTQFVNIIRGRENIAVYTLEYLQGKYSTALTMQ